ncbi:MAG: metallophosphatase family protein [Candidatus Omnitrophica bacterium]|nr:metallophosphatase family protein [Candidatus Omnitrophota bacterium]
MRYGIFSDIHSNLEALEAVLDFYKKQKINQFFCIGDIVGYGDNPTECIPIIQELLCPTVAGNHDWAVIEKFSLEYFNSYAKEAIIWTKGVLSSEEKSFLDSLRLVYQDKELTSVHSSLDAPSEFFYIDNLDSALRCFSYLETSLCFVGHSHIPVVFILDRANNLSYFSDNSFEINLDKDKRYIINVGSVGQPRDRDYRAGACIYDTEEKTVSFRRIVYDVASSAKKIIKAGLPSFLAQRLFLGR